VKQRVHTNRRPARHRPLVAHCHLGLGKLFRRTGKRQEAQEHLTIATTMYREMEHAVLAGEGGDGDEGSGRSELIVGSLMPRYEYGCERCAPAAKARKSLLS